MAHHLAGIRHSEGMRARRPAACSPGDQGDSDPRRPEGKHTTTPVSLGTVLLIDDDSFDQRIYRRVIERSGLVDRLVSFPLAEDALAWLRREGPENVDVIFLDINMPRMNGFEFLAAAADLFGEAKLPPVVMMLTTSLDPHDRARAASFEAVKAYISKPLTHEHVVEAAALAAQRVTA